MRLSYIILAAAVALAGLLDATSAAAVATIAKQGEANAVAFDPRSVGNNHRSLRSRTADPDDDLDNLDESNDFDDDDDQEERGFSLGLGAAIGKISTRMSDHMAVAAIATRFIGKDADEMGRVISSLSKADLLTLFDRGETELRKILPGFKTGMSFDSFTNLIKGKSSDEKMVMMVAYSKYLAYKGLL